MLFTHVYIFPCFGDKELSGYLFKCLLVEPGLRLISVCILKLFACSCRQELLPDKFYLPFSFRALFKFCDLTSFECVAPSLCWCTVRASHLLLSLLYGAVTASTPRERKIPGHYYKLLFPH